MIVDANFVIWLDEEDPENHDTTLATDFARELRDEGYVARVPTIIVWELYVSVGKGTAPIENQRSLQKLLSTLPVVALHDDIAR